jgi:hypothetical protein
MEASLEEKHYRKSMKNVRISFKSIKPFMRDSRTLFQTVKCKMMEVSFSGKYSLKPVTTSSNSQHFFTEPNEKRGI